MCRPEKFLAMIPRVQYTCLSKSLPKYRHEETHVGMPSGLTVGNGQEWRQKVAEKDIVPTCCGI